MPGHKDALLIFDCDGTLVDSEFLCNLGLEWMLRDYAVREDAQQLTERFRGWQLNSVLRSIEDQYGIQLPASFTPQYRATVARLFEQRLKPVDGIADALRALPNSLCVASSGPREKIQHALQLCELFEYFDPYIFSSYEINSWKPEPQLFLHAAQQMNYAAEQCVVIEDSQPGIEAANNAGMKSVFYNPHGIDIEAQATWTLSEMQQLPCVLR